MNIEFYKSLLAFRSHSKSPKQIEFRDWLREYIETHYQNTVTSVDEYGNLYVVKGSHERTVNCVIAHLDINQRTITDDIEMLEINNWILGIDRATGQQIGLGHDDKTGVYFCLQALKRFKNIRAFFPLDEEVGCVGSRSASPEFFENVGFMLQLDRRGYGDISTYTNGNDVLSLDTQKEFQPLLDAYGYKYTRTVSTDVGFLVGAIDIQGTNISCGYYNEHSNNEVLNTLQYDNAEQFGFSLLRTTTNKKYTIEQKKYVPPTYTPKPYTTNSTIGKPLNVIKGGKTTNSNAHLIDRKAEIDTYKGKPSYVTDIEFEDVEQKGYSSLTLEQKANNFRILWLQNSFTLNELAMMGTELLVDGYKRTVAYLIKETNTPDQEVIDKLDDMLDEIQQVAFLGLHDLGDAENTIKHFKKVIVNYYADGKHY